jgi:hypothetical protein
LSACAGTAEGGCPTFSSLRLCEKYFFAVMHRPEACAAGFLSIQTGHGLTLWHPAFIYRKPKTENRKPFSPGVVFFWQKKF